MQDSFGREGVVVPDVPEPIVGYRAWTVRAVTSKGQPPFRLTGRGGASWPLDAPLIAECVMNGLGPYMGSQSEPCGQVPSLDAHLHNGYGCGIYAYRTLEDLIAHGWAGPNMVWGTVALSGEVMEHEHGFRAAEGTPLSLIRLDRTPQPFESRYDIMAVAQSYSIPVEPDPVTPSATNVLGLHLLAGAGWHVQPLMVPPPSAMAEIVGALRSFNASVEGFAAKVQSLGKSIQSEDDDG